MNAGKVTRRAADGQPTDGQLPQVDGIEGTVASCQESTLGDARDTVALYGRCCLNDIGWRGRRSLVLESE